MATGCVAARPQLLAVVILDIVARYRVGRLAGAQSRDAKLADTGDIDCPTRVDRDVPGIVRDVRVVPWPPPVRISIPVWTRHPLGSPALGWKPGKQLVDMPISDILTADRSA